MSIVQSHARDLSFEKTHVDQPPQFGRFRDLVPIATRLLPTLTARFFARRYLQSEHYILKDAAKRRDTFEVLTCGDGALLRANAKGLAPDAPRCLIVPGHDGHFRQFLRMIRGFHLGGFHVDILALPGHLGRARPPCSMASIAKTVRAACDVQGSYHLLAAHCVSANAVLFELENGPLSERFAFLSTPLDLPALIRSGGEMIGLTGKSLSLFVEQVDALGAPYHLEKAWEEIAKAQTAPLLLMHSQDDFAAPVEDIAPLQDAWPQTQVALFESGDHNGVVASKAVIDRLVAFANDASDG